MLKAIRSLLLAAIALLALGTTISAQDKTELRVLRLGASADVLVNGGLVFTNLEEASDYAIVEPGEARIEIYSSGENEYPFLDSKLELLPGKSYSLLPVTGPEGENMEPFLVTDDRTRPAAGTAHVRALHGSPGTPVFDVAIKDGPVLLSGIDHMEAAAFTPVDAGTYDLELREAGTDEILFALYGATLKDGGIVTIVVSGVAAPLGKPSVSIVDYPALAPSTPVEKPATLPKTGRSVGPLGWLLFALAAIVAGSVLRRAAVAEKGRPNPGDQSRAACT